MKKQMTNGKVRLFSYFLLLCFAGSFALKLPAVYKNAQAVPYIDCLFTAVSAVCVTGLSTVDMAVYTPLGFGIILVLIELGGLGIITFITMLLARRSNKVSLVNRRLVRDYFLDSVEANPRKILIDIFIATLFFELIGALLLWKCSYFSGKPLTFFASLFLAVSSFCNAGFSPYSDNLASFSGTYSVPLILSVLIITGGIGFTVMKNIYLAVRHSKTHLTVHTKIVLLATASLLLGGTIVFFVCEYNHAFAHLSLPQKILAAWFQAVSPRTAGFELVPQKSLTLISSLCTMFLMFIGGSPGSIAGGIKITTMFLVVSYALRGNEEKIELNVLNRTIPSSVINKALSVVTKSVLILFVAVLALCISEHRQYEQGIFSFVDITFEAVSAFATVGLSRAVTPALSFAGKLILILTMFIGRTGIFAMALAMPEKKAERMIDYPEENVMVG